MISNFEPDTEEDFDQQLLAWLRTGCDRETKSHLAKLVEDLESKVPQSGHF